MNAITFTRSIKPTLFAIAVVLFSTGCHNAPDAANDTNTPDTQANHVPGVTGMSLDEALAMLDNRPAWDGWDDGRYPVHPAQKYLEGLVIVLDPGHGAKSLEVPGYKMGPTGVREAVMNLNVGLLLKKMLTDAGAIVVLTRETEFNEIADDRLDDTHLRRANLANTIERPDGGHGADLFISLHHNAASRPTANYTTVWFHGRAGDSEPGLDLARILCHHVGQSLRTDVGLTCPVMSDHQMYAEGFAVLRYSDVPSCLVEASFFTHLDEEQRLADAGHNLREAYAIYLGLCEWAYQGRPTQTPPTARVVESQLIIETTLSDGLPEWWGHDLQRVMTSSIYVEADGKALPWEYDPETKRLTMTMPTPDFSRGFTMEINLHHSNLMDHSNWPQRYALTFALEEGELALVDSVALGQKRTGREPVVRDLPGQHWQRSVSDD